LLTLLTCLKAFLQLDSRLTMHIFSLIIFPFFMLGQILINCLFGAALVSCGTYFLAAWRGLRLAGSTSTDSLTDHLVRTGRVLFVAVVVGMLVAAGFQLYNILTHDFTYSYVWGHSSRELTKPLLVATFYAGQEGSFMLWTLLTGAIGVSLLPYVRRHRYEAEVMAFYGLIIVFLLLMLVAKNPFARIWEAFPKDAWEGFVPPKGKGLNPLLHNIWITIHPPILFTGFASMSVPFVFAMAALIRRDYQAWVKISLPWILFGTGVLGFGIMLGGFWAYETLGWGGFWGWDPVENSSLIPWLVSVALVHTMLTQKKTGGLVKTNITLAVLCFLMVLYSTFLTRSGVLGDTSVHSFVDPGFFAYVLLLVFMLVFAVIGVGGILWRRRDIAAARAEFHPSSREFGLSLGAALVMASAIIVTIGTSWPLACELLKRPKVAIDIAYYNTMHLPLAIVILLLNGASVLLSWKTTTRTEFVRRMLYPLLASLALTGVAVVVGVRAPEYIAFTFGALFSLMINLQVALRLLRARAVHAGAFVAHVGVALIMLGIIATARYAETTHVRLPQGIAQNVNWGATGDTSKYRMLYVGREQIEKDFKDREKYRYFVALEQDGKQIAVVSPVLYWSDFNRRESAFLEPGIKSTLLRDLYVSPKGIETEGESPTRAVAKNEPMPLPFDSAYSVKLLSFDMSNAVVAAQSGSTDKGLKLGVVVEINAKGTTSVHTIYTTFLGKDGIAGATTAQRQEPLNIAGTQYYVALQRILPNKDTLSRSRALLAFADAAKPSTQAREVFTVEVSKKPLMSLVWAGVLVMTVGFFVSVWRRRGEIMPNTSSTSSTSSTPRGTNGTNGTSTHGTSTHGTSTHGTSVHAVSTAAAVE
jgi:cytochrome c-type biogenesis protein CcmF